MLASACCVLAAGLGLVEGKEPAHSPLGPSAAEYRSIQEALKANPGRKVFVPAGDYEIAEKIQIHGDGDGLFGPGCIVQTNPDLPILEIEHSAGVEVRDLTLTRAKGKTDTRAEAVLAIECRDLVLENLQVRDNRTCSGAIVLRACAGAQVRHCRIVNYMRISIDDRTANPDLGYAFRCIDGTGIVVKHGSRSVLIEGNRIVEENLLPTPEIKRKHDLGKFVKRNAKRGPLIGQKAWDDQYVNNWHQGSAIVDLGGSRLLPDPARHGPDTRQSAAGRGVSPGQRGLRLRARRRAGGGHAARRPAPLQVRGVRGFRPHRPEGNPFRQQPLSSRHGGDCQRGTQAVEAARDKGVRNRFRAKPLAQQ
jgi:hypothetical protein